MIQTQTYKLSLPKVKLLSSVSGVYPRILAMANSSISDENTNLSVQSPIPTSSALTQRKRNTYHNTYHLHVDVLPEYAPLKKRNKESVLPQREKERRRMNGEHHLDLWADGSMYPKDPLTNAPPPFANITNLLHFTGNGLDGLLGYTQHLEMRGLNAEKQRDFLLKENVNLKQLNDACIQKALANRETIQSLEKKIKCLHEKETVLGRRKRKRDLCNIEDMKIGSGGMKRRIRALR